LRDPQRPLSVRPNRHDLPSDPFCTVFEKELSESGYGSQEDNMAKTAVGLFKNPKSVDDVVRELEASGSAE